MEERKSGAAANAAITVPENNAIPAAAAPDVTEAPESAAAAGVAGVAGAAGAASSAGAASAAGAAAAAGAADAAGVANAAGVTDAAEAWQKRCQTAEESLAAAQSDAKDYYRLAARYGEAGPDAFARFVALRRSGLAPEEAFGALLGPAALADDRTARPASKAHLLGSAPKAYGSTLPTMSQDELRLARSLLGEDLSTEELEALYRRVVT